MPTGLTPCEQQAREAGRVPAGPGSPLPPGLPEPRLCGGTQSVRTGRTSGFSQVALLSDGRGAGGGLGVLRGFLLHKLEDAANQIPNGSRSSADWIGSRLLRFTCL